MISDSAGNSFSSFSVREPCSLGALSSTFAHLTLITSLCLSWHLFTILTHSNYVMESIFISTLTIARAGQLISELLNVKKRYQTVSLSFQIKPFLLGWNPLVVCSLADTKKIEQSQGSSPSHQKISGETWIEFGNQLLKKST